MDVLLQAVFICSIVGVLSAPVFEDATPFWLNPCGGSVALVSELEETFHLEQISWHEQLGKSLSKVRHQLKTAREQLIYKEFDNLYIDVRRGVEDRQYIPNWVPSKGDVEYLLSLDTFSTNEIAKYLPVLLLDLQKFAVAFEQVYRDEVLSNDKSPKKDALANLIGNLRQLLCEVESALWSLDLSFGPAINRNLMSTGERDIPDYTHRMIRDNGILFKYRDYLTGWNTLIRLRQLIKNLKKYRLRGKALRKDRKKKSGKLHKSGVKGDKIVDPVPI